ncbi:MAG: peptidoglycan recognition protein family protein [Planctomycetes bacterium]|nr:peptidoglycan recognition protein family protein [Planctomycetota bacterium]
MALRIPIIKPAVLRRVVSRRTRTVWAGFALAATLTSSLLVLGDADGPRPLAMATLSVGSSDASILPREAKLDRQRWTSIVIHHSSTPAGDAASVARLQGASDAGGLGYHFIIGNGQGIADGGIEVASRWNRQEPGAHVASIARRGHSASGATLVSNSATPSADELNRHAVGICLIGNGDRRPFTANQMSELATLVRRLQKELNIPADRVYLHSDVAGVSSPGRFFSAADFEAQLVQTKS